MRFLALALSLSLPFAAAQRYTVQTVALEDYRAALETAAQLRALDFDAYVDFAMFEGQQYARVRVGCFQDRSSAEAMTALLAGGVTAEAVVSEAANDAPARLCLRREMGFVLPQRWDVLQSTPTAVAYVVEVLGHQGFVVFDGEGWRLAQREGEALELMASGPVLASAAPGKFQAATRDGRPYVFFDGLIVANGQLLWQQGSAAVVLEGDAVVAYHVAGGAP